MTYVCMSQRVCLCVQFYNFTTFALLLNEIDDCLRSKIPPTDSRLRPDMRTMEEGDFGEYTLQFTHAKLYPVSFPNLF